MVNGGSSDSVKLDAPTPEAGDSEAVGMSSEFARDLAATDAEQQGDWNANAKHAAGKDSNGGPNRQTIKAYGTGATGYKGR